MATAGWLWWGMVPQTWRRACLTQQTSSSGRIIVKNLLCGLKGVEA
jgi:hypothetical protein